MIKTLKNNTMALIIFGIVLFNIKWGELELIHWACVGFLIIAMVLYLFPYHSAHFLNNLFKLPHPGPNDPQGSCLCRRHEGKNKYSLMDYVLNKKK